MPYRDLNRVTLIGRLTRDPEPRALPSGATVCGLRIACNGIRKEGDVYQERPNYFDVSVFGATGEHVERSLHKGSRVALDGHLEWREWETSEAHRRQAVTIVADSVQFLDRPTDSQRDRDDDDGALDEDDQPHESTRSV
jgi:single-strand DNA-binding protein